MKLRQARKIRRWALAYRNVPSVKYMDYAVHTLVVARRRCLRTKHTAERRRRRSPRYRLKDSFVVRFFYPTLFRCDSRAVRDIRKGVRHETKTG